MSSVNANTNGTALSSHKRPRQSVDAMLNKSGKAIAIGATSSIPLVKSVAVQRVADPVDATAPTQAFPLVAKFPESVVKPDFAVKFAAGRLYQQDVPKVADDSDDEQELTQSKRRWTRAQPKQPPRQWILQEQVDFLETMVARREGREIDSNALSSRYEGQSEANNSHYVLCVPQANGTVAIRLLPMPHTVTFAQPAARKTYSLSEAEQALNEKRMVYHMHTQQGKKQQQHATSSKSRLLSKLDQKARSAEDAGGAAVAHHETGGVGDADDVMADVAFRNRKGNAGTMRELYDNVAVSNEGVMGGANDAIFGVGQKFGNFTAHNAHKNQEGNNTATAATTERGADGAAMADDFYQRDVQAEYDELDYDANEQFDDDDVDLGEGEVTGNNEGGDAYDSDDDELDVSDEDEEVVGGAAGLASVAGFKLMLAKARGEVPPDESAAATATPAVAKNARVDDKKDEKDHMTKIMAAAERSAAVAAGGGGPPAAAAAAAPTARTAAAAAIPVDENGLRVISLDAVRREIWLNHGSIPMKRLMKIFDVRKKSSEQRQAEFREVVKELCTIKTDPVHGRLLVLKQHYSNM